MPLEQKENADYIKWDPKLELGIPVIDDQHKKLVALCNNLYQGILRTKAVGVASWQDSLRGTLKECADYVMVHFRDEEKILQAVGYSDFASHKAQHEIYTKKILETVQNFNNITISDAIQFVKFLYDWIMSHIAYTDKLYVKTVQEYYAKRQQA